MVLTKYFLPILLLIGTSNALSNSTILDDIIKSYLSDCWNNELNQPCPVTQSTSVTEPESCGRHGICVPRYQCSNNEIVTSGADAVDLRMDNSEPHMHNSECTDRLYVCCHKPKEVRDPTPVACGLRNNNVLLRIDSDVTEFAEFPWMVAILREIPDTYVITLSLYVCGGSLIAPTVILTAAHCVRQLVANNLIARAGEWNTQSKTEVLPYQDRRVHEIILNENFDKASFYNDIALLIVDNPFIYVENVRPICLPPPTANFDHSRCYATGWGKDKDGRDGFYQPILKKVELPVVPRNQCQTNLRRTRVGAYYILHESFICAGGELGKDTCEGDGGSPLVCPIEGKDNQFYQAGIVVYGVGCGEENVPGVYTNVAHLRPWINEKLFQMRVNFSDFTP